MSDLGSNLGVDFELDWDTYYMAQCFLISMRSPDTTKHGAIIVGPNNSVLSQGYNGPVDGMDDSFIPMTRPDKYSYMIHAEENSILSFNGYIPEGSRIYVTGMPCSKCTRMILRKRIFHIIYGPQGSNCVDELDLKATLFMIEQKGAKLESYDNKEKLLEVITRISERVKLL